MKVLHITPHLGGGVGSVIMGWMSKVTGHSIICLDYANPKTKEASKIMGFPLADNMASAPQIINQQIRIASIVVVHYWDNKMLADLLSRPLPACRMVFWCHKNIPYTDQELHYPDVWIDTSPIQGHGKYIWSTGGVSRFLEIKPKAHEGFNIGYIGTVDYKKLHPLFPQICFQICETIHDARFTIVGENTLPSITMAGFGDRFNFTGKVDDIAPYLAEMNVFAYPLRPDHYGTCEQVLGEAMAAGVVPVIMDNPTERTICTPDKKGFPSGIKCRYEDEYPKAIKWIYEHPELRKKYSDNCRTRAKELYSLDTMISAWNNVFDSMMSNPKTPKKGML